MFQLASYAGLSAVHSRPSLPISTPKSVSAVPQPIAFVTRKEFPETWIWNELYVDGNDDDNDDRFV